MWLFGVWEAEEFWGTSLWRGVSTLPRHGLRAPASTRASKKRGKIMSQAKPGEARCVWD